MNQHSLKKSQEFSQFKILLPILIPIIFFSLLPLGRGIYLGFTDYTLGSSIKFNGFENYFQLFKDHYFWKSFQVGIVWTIAVSFGQLILGMGLALLLHSGIKFFSIYSVLIVIPWAMPPIIRGIVWRQIYDPDSGILNSVLMHLNMIMHPINWLSSFEHVIPAVIVAGIWGGVPQTTIFLLAGLKNISTDVYDAAKLDGAGIWTKFSKITLPLLKPTLAAVLSLNFLWNFNSFGLVWVLTQGGPGGLTRLPMLAAYEEAFRYGYVGYAAAIGNVMIIILSVVLYFYLRIQFKEQVKA
ncbi:MAG: sugar ABC transporter permease [Candidatus Marinimicrobia bacterium]|jgi:multiple sugar transport system permease protein|nr:sugar ABC transporter permease [Candidatus Neomarinimicrobiota bacterium]|tara:strand:+ start:6460 stop:7350 length:891 start_codon:yes stop_codon:yes gene_type:complete